MPRRTQSVQDRHGQTVYIPSTDPINADVRPSSVTVTPGATTTAPAPGTAVAGSPSARRGQAAGNAEMTVTAPPGVEVHHDADARTFTLTFGVVDGGGASDTTKVSSAQLIWQPPRPAGTDRAEGTDPARAPADDVRETSAAKPPLSRILTESTEEPPETPTSPDERKS